MINIDPSNFLDLSPPLPVLFYLMAPIPLAVARCCVSRDAMSPENLSIFTEICYFISACIVVSGFGEDYNTTSQYLMMMGMYCTHRCPICNGKKICRKYLLWDYLTLSNTLLFLSPTPHTIPLSFIPSPFPPPDPSCFSGPYCWSQFICVWNDLFLFRVLWT